AAGVPALPWIALLVLGLACAAALYALHRTGRHRCSSSAMSSMFRSSSADGYVQGSRRGG
ncbi:hypothetical protein ACWDYK_27375, partial [Streptomyces anthocyanicus]